MEPTRGKEVQQSSQYMEGQYAKQKLQGKRMFDQELWRKKKVFGLRKTVYSQKNSYIYIHI
jgi:hypothetical protein